MSCYIVKYATMNRVANYYAKHHRIDLESNNFKKLVKKLWDLNVKALIERYGEKERNQYDRYISEYVFEFEKLPTEFEKDIKLLMKYFKSFCNYNYQCCEGNITKKKLYKECERLECELAKKITTALPEWNEGEWE